jgi:site-specific recombinase XerD
VKIRNSVKVHLIEFTKKVINEYRNPDSNKMQDYVFDVLNINMSDAEKHKKKKNFNRKINQHFLKLARTLEIEENISFAWARHSFATISILAGVRLELVSKQLTHTSLETTMLYFKGFEDDTYKQVSDKILDFSKKTVAHDSKSLTKCVL